MTSLKGTKLLPARGTLLLSQSGDLSQRLPPSFRKTDPGNTKRELEFSFGLTLLSFNSVPPPPHRIPLLTMAHSWNWHERLGNLVISKGTAVGAQTDLGAVKLQSSIFRSGARRAQFR